MYVLNVDAVQGDHRGHMCNIILSLIMIIFLFFLHPRKVKKAKQKSKYFLKC